MSSLIAIWIDSSQAKFFKFGADNVETFHMSPHGPIHHVETLGMNHTKAEGDTERFYHQVAEYLQKDPNSKCFVMGAGLGHTHFVHHIQKYHPHFFPNIVGNRSVDQMTDGQIRDVAHKFFIESGLCS